MHPLKVKTFHITVGLDLIGSKTSLQTSALTKMVKTQDGIYVHSAKSNRLMFIPNANIKGAELIADAETLAQLFPEEQSTKRGPGRPPKASE